MGVLPSTNIDISGDVTFRNQPGLTYYADPVSHRISGKVDGLTAVRQTIEVILNVERFRWQIYTPNFGMRWDGLIGQQPGYVSVELQRRLKDAFSVDSRIRGISGFKHSVSGDKMTVSFTVNTVFGEIEEQMEVGLA